MKIQSPNLNHLIDKGVEPKPDMEYILFGEQIHDTEVWTDKILYIPAGTIVVNVKIKRNVDGDFLGYNFTVKETGLESHTNYPWNLLEYTPENMAILEEYNAKEAVLKKLTKELNKFRKKLATLEIK